MITLISTPAYIDPVDPSLIGRWLATESPNNFRLLRRDWNIITQGNDGLGMFWLMINDFIGQIGNDITVYSTITGLMYIGKITNIDLPNNKVYTNIPWVSGISFVYMNDNTLHGGYYFEGRLTVNDILYPLTIMASPDSFGYADLDVSGILRIVTSLGKVGDYSDRIMKETTKSGKFNFEYRECWYGSNNTWEGDVITSPIASPPIMNDWYYGECIRSEEQGSNLHDYVPDILHDAPFLNQFTQPVYFRGLPFDLSFILPEIALVSPASHLVVTIKFYTSTNNLIPGSTIIEYIDADTLEGFINSLNIDPTDVPDGADHMTAEVEI